jgi:hypothetical protein
MFILILNTIVYVFFISLLLKWQEVTIKQTLDFANRNISISTVLNDRKLFGCCATLGLVVHSTPTLSDSVVLNFGWIDAALIV